MSSPSFLPHLHLIGTSHVASQSVREIEQAFETWKPDIVAVELDEARLFALFEKKRRGAHPLDMFRIGLGGFLFSLIGSYVQRKIGSIVGMDPGSEMKRAVELAHANGAQVALIDQPVELTLRRFSEEVTLREKARLVSDIAAGLVLGDRHMKEWGLQDMDLSKVPKRELVLKLLQRVSERYPLIYRVLVSERNEAMAGRLILLMREHPEKKILAVVGAGHVEGMAALLNVSSM